MPKKKESEENVSQEVVVTDSIADKIKEMDGLTLSLAVFGAAYGGYLLSGGYMRKVILHPLVVFGAGALSGAIAYKHRKRIVQTANDLLESGTDYVLEGKEKLSDLIAEAKAEGEQDPSDK